MNKQNNNTGDSYSTVSHLLECAHRTLKNHVKLTTCTHNFVIEQIAKHNLNNNIPVVYFCIALACNS